AGLELAHVGGAVVLDGRHVLRLHVLEGEVLDGDRGPVLLRPALGARLDRFVGRLDVGLEDPHPQRGALLHRGGGRPRQGEGGGGTEGAGEEPAAADGTVEHGVSLLIVGDRDRRGRRRRRVAKRASTLGQAHRTVKTGLSATACPGYTERVEQRHIFSAAKEPAMISDRDVAFYREAGYVVVPDVLDPGTLGRLRDEIARVLEGAREVSGHTAVYDLEPGHRPDAPRVRRIKTPHRFFPDFEKLFRDPRIVGIVQQLLGPDVRLHGSKINLKAPHYGSPVEWHQDWAFYPHTNDDLLAVGVMLDDCALDNGPLLVVPGSHRGPTWDHHAGGYFCGAVDPSAIQAEIARAVPLVGRAGSMSFHHVRALHGSAHDVSDQPRAPPLYEHRPAHARPPVG